MPVREDTYPWKPENEVGEGPIPFIIAFIFTVFPLRADLLLGRQIAIIQLGLKCGSIL